MLERRSLIPRHAFWHGVPGLKQERLATTVATSMSLDLGELSNLSTTHRTMANVYDLFISRPPALIYVFFSHASF